LSALQTSLEKDIKEQEKFFEELEKLESNYQEILGIIDNYTKLVVYRETQKAFEDFKREVEKLKRKLEFAEGEKEFDAERGKEDNKMKEYCKNNWEEYCKISRRVEERIDDLLKSMEEKEKQQYEAKIEIFPESKLD
ncbi:2276_t:CDS:1, partial [Paraglomus occultum]